MTTIKPGSDNLVTNVKPAGFWRRLTLPVIVGIFLSLTLLPLFAWWLQTNELADSRPNPWYDSYAYACIVVLYGWGIVAAVWFPAMRLSRPGPTSWWVVLWMQIPLLMPLVFGLGGTLGNLLI